MVAGAEPIAFEQAANVTGLAGIEAGVDVDYSYTKVESGGITLSENTLMDVPVFVRAGFPFLEAKLTIPYSSAKIVATGGGSTESFSGLGDIGLMLKSNLLPLPVVSMTLGLETTFATGDPAKMLGEGQDFYPFVAADVDLSLLKLHANLGYQIRGEYEIEIGAGGPTPTMKINPGDAFKYALGLDMPVGMFSLNLELLGAGYASATADGVTVDDSAGNTMSIVPGARLYLGPFKAKLGVEIPLQAKDALPEFAPTADWRVLAGASLQFSL
jgi:hypothetical protein